jgi:aminopeptidase
LKHYPKISDFKFKNTDAFIYINAPKNRNELKDADPRKMILRRKILEPIDKIRIKKKWVIFDWPTKTLAKDAGMSLNAYRKFVFSSSILDWKKESEKLKKICSLLNKTDKVRIVSKDTDIAMSVKGMTAIIGNGSYNMPDGEIFTAPVKNSVNGFIKFSFPLRSMGRKISGIYLEFRNGKVVKAKADKNEKFLKHLLKTDNDAGCVGELGIGCNYNIKKFTDNLLFDEKIGGTIHLALGNAYPECLKGKKGSKSAIHADIVKDLRKGGRMYFDGKLVEENGKFKI